MISLGVGKPRKRRRTAVSLWFLLLLLLLLFSFSCIKTTTTFVEYVTHKKKCLCVENPKPAFSHTTAHTHHREERKQPRRPFFQRIPKYFDSCHFKLQVKQRGSLGSLQARWLVGGVFYATLRSMYRHNFWIGRSVQSSYCRRFAICFFERKCII